MTANPALDQSENLGSAWWRQNAWNQDTFELVTSITSDEAKTRLMLAYIRALNSDNEGTAPPAEFAMRALWKLLTEQDATPEQLNDPDFWGLFFHRAGTGWLERTGSSNSRDGWGKIKSGSLNLILRTTTFEVPDSCLDDRLSMEYLTNPHLTAERLDHIWNSTSAAFGEEFQKATTIIAHPNVSGETLKSIFDTVMAKLSSTEETQNRPFSGVDMRNLLAAPLANRAFPRGAYESYSHLFSFPQPLDGAWVRGGSEEQGAAEWVVLPWYATREQVQEKWDDRMGRQHNLSLSYEVARYELNGFEVQSLQGVEALEGEFEPPSNAHWIDPSYKNAKTQEEVEQIISTLKQSGPWNFFNIEGGEYDERTWVDLFNGMSKTWTDSAVKFTQGGLIKAALAGETTPDWLRFLVGIDTPHLRHLRHTWLFFHGGAMQWKKSFGFDNVPDEWVVEMLTPGGIDKPGDNNWRR